MARKQTEAMSYGIIGLGRFGSALAATLAEADKELMVLDRSEEKIRQARNYTEHAYVVKDLQKETLRETGIQNCDVVVVCIGDKVDVSILTTLNVINLGVPQVVAKANSPEQGEILEKIGARWYILKGTWQSAWPEGLSPSAYSISLSWTRTWIYLK